MRRLARAMLLLAALASVGCPPPPDVAGAASRGIVPGALAGETDGSGAPTSSSGEPTPGVPSAPTSSEPQAPTAVATPKPSAYERLAGGIYVAR
jgi:hypothetical protein